MNKIKGSKKQKKNDFHKNEVLEADSVSSTRLFRWVSFLKNRK